MTEMELVTTRRFLHGAAELLLAGPQHRATGRIDLRVVDGGFATVAAPDLRVEGDELLTDSGRVSLNAFVRRGGRGGRSRSRAGGADR
jgi:hypothetical protein